MNDSTFTLDKSADTKTPVEAPCWEPRRFFTFGPDSPDVITIWWDQKAEEDKMFFHKANMENKNGR